MNVLIERGLVAGNNTRAISTTEQQQQQPAVHVANEFIGLIGQEPKEISISSGVRKNGLTCRMDRPLNHILENNIDLKQHVGLSCRLVYGANVNVDVDAKGRIWMNDTHPVDFTNVAEAVRYFLSNYGAIANK